MSENDRLWTLVRDCETTYKAPRDIGVMFPSFPMMSRASDVIGHAISLVVSDRLGDGQLAEITGMARRCFDIDTITQN